MYKNNSRDSGEFKDFSPPQLSCNLKEMKLAAATILIQTDGNAFAKQLT